MTITAERLRELRESRRLSQGDIAKMIGVSRSTYVGYETGNSRPIRKIKELSALFGVSTDYILGNSDNPEPIHQAKSASAAAPPAPRLTQQEQDLLHKYRTLTADHRNAADSVIDTFYQQDKPKTEDTEM